MPLQKSSINSLHTESSILRKRPLRIAIATVFNRNTILNALYCIILLYITYYDYIDNTGKLLLTYNIFACTHNTLFPFFCISCRVNFLFYLNELLYVSLTHLQTVPASYPPYCRLVTYQWRSLSSTHPRSMISFP